MLNIAKYLKTLKLNISHFRFPKYAIVLKYTVWNQGVAPLYTYFQAIIAFTYKIQSFRDRT